MKTILLGLSVLIFAFNKNEVEAQPKNIMFNKFVQINKNMSYIKSHEDVEVDRNSTKKYFHHRSPIIIDSATDQTRKTTFAPFPIDKTCLLKPDKGPCRAKINMYFFSPENKNCSTFLWGGCQGNGNRFDTHRDCISTCLSQPGYNQGRPRYCSLTFDYGWCFGAEERWYYDHRYKVCKKTIYSGCGGNKNNFYAREQCDQLCRFGNKALKTHRKVPSAIKKVLVVDPVDKNPAFPLPEPLGKSEKSEKSR